jgi:hypothetical protein
LNTEFVSLNLWPQIISRSIDCGGKYLRISLRTSGEVLYRQRFEENLAIAVTGALTVYVPLIPITVPKPHLLASVPHMKHPLTPASKSSQ